MIDRRRIATIVRIRALEERTAKASWAEHRQRLSAAEERLDAYETHVLGPNVTATSESLLSVAQLRARRDAVDGALAHTDRLRNELRLRADDETRHRAVFLEAKMRHEGVARLESRVIDASYTAELKAEQNELDDVTNARHKEQP